MTELHEVIVDHRYRGPARSGNGGYCCGLVARHLEGPATVTLRSPPPLDRPMVVRVDDDAAQLLNAGVVVGHGHRDAIDLEVVTPPTLAQAETAMTGYVGYHTHPLPECFVCGPQRVSGDGLCIYTGPLDGSDVVASSWTPDPTLDDGEGHVASEYFWAALDCPSYFALGQPGLPALLGRMTAELLRPAKIGEPLIVVGWPLGSEGRKHRSASAIFTADGELLGKADALWIQVHPDILPN